MSADKIQVTRTSAATSEVSAIEIRSTKTGRLVFLPELVINNTEPLACVKGNFVYQKKSVNDEWEDIRGVDLNRLKSGEGIRLEFHSKELRDFMLAIWQLYEIRRKEGGLPPQAVAEFFKADESTKALLKLSEGELGALLQSDPQDGARLVGEIITWATAENNKGTLSAVVSSLKELDAAQLSLAVKVESLKRFHDTWEQNKNTDKEEFWQQTITEFPYAFSLMLPYSAVIVEKKAYVGGKRVDNSSGNLADYVIASKVGKNCAVVEIKTPCTSLVGAKYRGNSYAISSEVSGGLVQLQNYIHSLIHTSHEKGFLPEHSAFHPHGILICGTIASLGDEERKSFELFRNGIRNVQIICYDEFFGKAAEMLELLSDP